MVVTSKKHVFGSGGKIAGMGCQTLARALVIMVLRRNFTPNGTAIGVVCVTWRSYPANSPVCWQGTVPVARQVWLGICDIACGWFCDRGI